MDNLNKRLGPLPVYAWALIVAAALLLRHAAQRNHGYVTSATSNVPPLHFDTAGAITNSGAPSNGGGMHLGKGQLGPLVVTPPLGQDN
jgi:hypothetical protein